MPDDADYRSFHLGYYEKSGTKYYDEEFQLDLIKDNDGKPKEIYILNYMDEDEYYCIEKE